MKQENQVSQLHNLFALRERGRHQEMLGEVIKLPTHIYSDQDYLEKEFRSVFRDFPIVAGHASKVREPGSYILSDWGKFPFIVVRGNDGKLRAFLNTCRHRGAQLVDDTKDQLQAFVCPYHGWNYTLDGKIKVITQSYNFPDLDRTKYNLREFPVAEHMGLVWIHPSFGADLNIQGYLGEIAEDIEHFNIDNLVIYKKTKVIKNANWKLLLKTYLEGYHVPYLHRDTLYRSFKKGVIAHYEHGPNIRLVAARTNIEDAHRIPEEQWRILDYASVYYTLFPNTFFIMHPDYVSINQFWPQTPNKTLWPHEMLYRPQDFPDEIGQESLAKRFTFTDAVFDNEDFAVAEGVQRGLDFAHDEVHTLGLEEGLVAVFQRSIDEAIACNGDTKKQLGPYDKTVGTHGNKSEAQTH
jgi:phenylpropionate dioxygenase-like ring-hydroxylating dioxygenase large terminal subunit